MSVEVSVGPEALTINHGGTFMVTDLHGEIDADSEHGIFANDTRFVSSYRLYTNGEPLRAADLRHADLLPGPRAPHQPGFATEDGDVAAGDARPRPHAARSARASTRTSTSPTTG